jgi:hypothetical protein
LTIIAELKESVANQGRQLDNLDFRLSALEPNLTTDLRHLKRTRIPPVSPPESLKEVKFPLHEAKSLDGIISYLTRKHGGNVHDKGIVTHTSKSVLNDDSKYAMRNVADLTSGSYFESQNEPGQWVCWDFRELRVRPSHYTMTSWRLKSFAGLYELDRN